MDSPKSQLQLYADLLIALLLEDPCKLERAKSLNRDVETVRSRSHAEGFGFLTKSLPALGKALDKALESGKLIVPRGFPLKKDESRPAFMQAYFSYLFDLDGTLLADRELAGEVVRHLRQVLFACYKLELPYQLAEEQAVIERFLGNERELGELQVGSDHIIEVASHLAENIFDGFEPDDITPRHGPGAVATGEKLEDKWTFKRVYSSINNRFPYRDYFMVGADKELSDRRDWCDSLEWLDEGHAKVVLVPKDSRGPRLISCEPLEYQWIQQGLGRALMHHLETSRYTRGQINFTSQEVNRSLAHRSSLDRKWATLDLKDASDRVSLALVQQIFGRKPRLLSALEATRTSSTTLPSGEVVHMKKFAPMGSALCFPVEATVFWLLLVADLCSNGRLPLEVAARCVYVYGDDIIVPTEHATRAMQVLESVGLRVNKDKSCIQGYFRESCGMDAFKGVCVTPTRFKKLWSGKQSDASAYTSYLEVSNNLRDKGYVKAADYLVEQLAETYGVVPWVATGVSSHGLRSPSVWMALWLNAKAGLKQRWNEALSRFEVRARVTTVGRRPTTLDGWPRLLRNMVTPVSEEPDTVVLPYSTKIKYGWLPVHY